MCCLACQTKSSPYQAVTIIKNNPYAEMKVQLKGTELRKLTTRVDDSQTKLKGIYLPDIMKPTFSQT